MSFGDFFTIKSLREKKREQEQYNRWAFPYGQAQLEKMRSLILELMPDEKKTGIAIYLIGREAYQDAEGEAAPIEAYEAMASMLTGRHRKKIFTFLALIRADAEIDEELKYPDAETIRQEAKRLEETL